MSNPNPENRPLALALEHQALLEDVRCALGPDYFTKGQDVLFLEIEPDGWDGPSAAAIQYDDVLFFRDQGHAMAARSDANGHAVIRLEEGMGETALPWNLAALASMN